MLYCGLDIGTTNTKAVVFDSKGALQASCSKAAGGVDWFHNFSAVMDLVTAKVGKGPKAVSISSQGGSFVFLDQDYKPISPFIIWTELAAAEYQHALGQLFGSVDYYRKTGWHPADWLAVCKIRQELEKNSELKLRYKYIATVPDFIHACLCCKFVTDITNAQITGLCDFQKAEYDEDILNWAGISCNNLAPVMKTMSIIADGIKTKWGDIILTTSSHDQYAAMEAAELEPDRDIMLATGTAWVFNITSRTPFFDETSFSIHPGRDIYNDKFGNIVTLGPIGKEFDELLNKHNIDHEKLSEIEAEFLNMRQYEEPIFSEKWQKYSVSSKESSKAIRDYMSYTASIVAFFSERLEVSSQSGRILMTGGAAKSRFWPQVIADMTGRDVELIDFMELTALGAARYCQKALGSGIKPGLYECVSKKVVSPSGDNLRQWFLNKQLPVIKEKLNRE